MSSYSKILTDKPCYNVLVHYHIMKNAGTTISAILRREFNGAYAEIHGPDAGSMICTSDLLEFLHEHREIRAISSHHVRFPIPSEERLHFAYCCFIRHPLDRLHSLYSFFRGSGDDSVVGQMARNCTPPVFFSQLMDRFPNYICNIQTNYLANSGFFLRPPGQEDLRIACRVMQDCTLPGVVHRTNESLTVAEYFLNPLYPGIRLHHPPENVTRKLERSLSERGREFRELCGRKVYAELLDLNRLDLELMRQTEEEVERRRKLIPYFETRLANFEQRCAPTPDNQSSGVAAQTSAR